MTDLAMGYLTLGELDPFEMVRAAGKGGFRASGIRLTGHRPGDPWPFDPADADHIARMRAVMQASGVTLVNACTYRFSRETGPDAYAPVLAACAALGIGTVIANSFEDDEAVVIAHLGEVARMAARQGIRLALEFIPVSGVKTLADALRIAEATGCSNVGLVVDALHLHRSGGSAVEVARAPRERLFAVQLCDGPEAAPTGEALKWEMRAGRLLPGEGTFDLRSLLRAMPRDAEIEAEVPNAAFDALLTPTEKATRVREGTEAFLKSFAPEILS